jgi:GntR family transcriptional regulator
MHLDDLTRALAHHMRPGLPKYLALADAIVSSIKQGVVTPGQRMPNEQDLAAGLPLSLGTIQRAFRELVQLGVVERRQGHGTFIRQVSRPGQLTHPFHCRFIDDTGEGYLPVFPEILSRRVVGHDGRWAEFIGPGTALEITRKFSIGGEFVMFSRFYCDPMKVPALMDQPIEILVTSNFKDAIFRSTGIAIKKTETFISLSSADEEIAKILGMTVGGAFTKLRALGRTSDGEVIYYQEIFIPPNKRELHFITDAHDAGFSSVD